MMRRLPGLADIPGRPLLAGLAGLGLALAVAAGPVLAALDAWGAIDLARARLDLARAAASRPPAPLPLSAASPDALTEAFRGRLEALAAERAVVIDRAALEEDSARPALPRLRADLRGTAEGLHGLLDALETGAPLVAVEEADLRVERPADAEIGRTTLMRLALTVRGVLVAEAAAPRRAP